MSIQKFLLNKIKTCGNVDEIRAYAETLEFVLNAGNQVTMKLVERGEGGIIPVIKELRAKFNFSLQESKRIVESNLRDLQPMTKEDALHLQRMLESVGAKVEIVTTLGA